MIRYLRISSYLRQNFRSDLPLESLETVVEPDGLSGVLGQEGLEDRVDQVEDPGGVDHVGYAEPERVTVLSWR